MNLFGMISTKASQRYTRYAVESFFAHTELGADERLTVIDNDGDLAASGLQHPRLSIEKNTTPQSFAANANTMIRRALACKADLYFLNNDLILSQGWYSALCSAPAGIASPLCNQQLQCQAGSLRIQRSMELADYLGHEAEFSQLVQAYRARAQGTRGVMSLPFFCVRFSHELLCKLGLLDTSFGRGGAEDNDYCLRAVLAGLPINYVLGAYVLHFSGKSTWSGGETEEETKIRVSKFKDVFRRKWGQDLLRLIVELDDSSFRATPELLTAAQRGDLRAIVELLLRREGVTPPPLFIEGTDV